MAISKSEAAMYAFITGRVLPKGTTRKVLRKGLELAGVGAARAAPVVASTALANPFATGTALGLGALATPPGQTLLAAAAARGAADRIAAQQMLDEAIFRSTTLPARQISETARRPDVQRAAKRKVSKYSKAVKAGMAAVKASSFGGKKGKISNAKSAFKTVNLVASAVNKGKKVSAKGIRGTVARAVRRILK